jgi:formylmethanofuran dehydrogenase subunit C
MLKGEFMRFGLPAAPVRILAASNRFGKYKDEAEKAARNQAVEDDQTLRQLREAWLNVQWKGDLLELVDENCSAVLESVGKMRYSARDIEKFSVALGEYAGSDDFPGRAGYFLSCLINNGQDGDYTIHTNQIHDKEGIHFIGLRNTKNITVIGAAMHFAGFRMRGGRLIVEGNVYWSVGDGMENGEIIVNGFGGYYAGSGMNGGLLAINGSVSGNAGNKMRGGHILIRDDAGEDLGKYMKGGKITVMGRSWHSIGPIEGGEIHIHGEERGGISVFLKRDRKIDYRCGKIFHKGELIYPEG